MYHNIARRRSQFKNSDETGIILWRDFPRLPTRPSLANCCALCYVGTILAQSCWKTSSLELDWPEFARLAAWHSLAGVVYQRLREFVKQGLISKSALDELRPIYLAQVSASMLRTYWLGQILRELHARDIPVIVLKGAYLADVVYADSALRPMGDIDLLVRQEDLQAVAQTLTDLGYQASKEFWLDFELQVGKHLPPFVKTGAPPIELHWRLLDPDIPFEIDQAGLWQRACPVKDRWPARPGVVPGGSAAASVPACHRPPLSKRTACRLRHRCHDHAFPRIVGLEYSGPALSGLAGRAGAISLALAGSRSVRQHLSRLDVLQELEPVDFSAEQAALARHLVFATSDDQSNIPLHLAELVQAPSAWA